MGTTSIADVDKQIAKAKKDAEAGNAIAQYNLGVLYASGTGVAIDLREAFKWYTRAAEAGNAEAQCNLGLCYDLGTGIAVDKCKAVKWFQAPILMHIITLERCCTRWEKVLTRVKQLSGLSVRQRKGTHVHTTQSRRLLHEWRRN